MIKIVVPFLPIQHDFFQLWLMELATRKLAIKRIAFGIADCVVENNAFCYGVKYDCDSEPGVDDNDELKLMDQGWIYVETYKKCRIYINHTIETPQCVCLNNYSYKRDGNRVTMVAFLSTFLIARLIWNLFREGNTTLTSVLLSAMILLALIRVQLEFASIKQMKNVVKANAKYKITKITAISIRICNLLIVLIALSLVADFVIW